MDQRNSPSKMAALRLYVSSSLMLVVATACGVSRGEETPVASHEVAIPAARLSVPDGFRAELIRSAGTDEGSWISMTFDDRGRLILARDDVGLVRLTLPGKGKDVVVESIDHSLRHCRGLLYAYGSLYVAATNSNGFYRLRDTNGDDQFDEKKLLTPLDYRSRYGHGPNQVVLGPDKMIYLVNGDDVSFPAGTASDSPYRDPQNDWLLPNPHDAGQDNRVGHILRTDPEGTRWEVIAGGFRNQFDIAFNADGEMFTFDADMEWDVGLPWYRPTRINHVVSGGEYGWRWGTGKWPAYYVDSLPTTLDMGLGSPTGLVFGYDSQFPPRYQQALFAADWQNGRILAIYLTPRGASYAGRSELFLEGAPLNVCDMAFGPDGALYFITGGRGSQSGLYRVTCVDPARVPPGVDKDNDDQDSMAAAREARALRHRLESFQTRPDPQAVEIAWPHLASAEVWIRYAARLAVERQDVNLWRGRALAEIDPLASVMAMLALARVGRTSDQSDLLASLGRLQLAELDNTTLLAALRVYSLSFIRQGRPDDTTAQRIAARLDSLYPHESSLVNRELCELLVYLAAPGVIEKTLSLIKQAPSQEEQIYYAQALSRLERGWTLSSRREVLAWLARSRSFRGGHLLPTALKNIRDDYLAALSDDERTALAAEIAELNKPQAEAPIVANRPLVRRWKMEDLADVAGAAHGRSFASARQALAAAACLSCHRIGDEGSSIGPDLTNVGRRFDARTVLESILTPSKVIDPKYRSATYELDSGQVVTGRAVSVNRDELVIETDPLAETTVKVRRSTIVESYPSTVSPMPEGLLDTLSKDEILDLVAYLIAGGNSNDALFKK